MPPTDLQLALFRAVEDVHDQADATVVLLTDERGDAVAVSGDDSLVPPELRAVLSASALAEKGSVRALLSDLDLSSTSLNVAVHPIGTTHLLAILFDAEADFSTVEEVGREARTKIARLLAGDLN